MENYNPNNFIKRTYELYKKISGRIPDELLKEIRTHVKEYNRIKRDYTNREISDQELNDWCKIDKSMHLEKSVLEIIAESQEEQ